MKRTIIILIAVVCLLLIYGCQKTKPAETASGQEQTQEKQAGGEEIKTDEEVQEPEDDVIDDEEGVFVDPVDTVAFYSLEEFNEAILNAPEGDDIADLANLDVYYLPTSLPDGYELYKIVAGSYDIGFWYMPEECLSSEKEAASAEVQGRYFLFISGNRLTEELRDGVFTIEKGVRDMVSWNADGHTLHLYVSADYEGDYADLLQAEAVYINQ
jgi:hypothetical protein